MERKDYLERIIGFKNDILNEIQNILPTDTVHYFAETFFVHYIEGEVATTELCTSVEVDKDGSVVFHVRPEGAGTERIADESVFQYEPESFMDILFNLKKEIREKKLSELRALVDRNGGKISFDGNFLFDGNESDGIIGHCHLDTLELVDGILTVSNTYMGDPFVNEESFIDDGSLDDMIEYVKSQTKKKFSIRVSGSWSREYVIEATSYEEALEEAKDDFANNPICYYDSNGEDWERIS